MEKNTCWKNIEIFMLN